MGIELPNAVQDEETVELGEATFGGDELALVGEQPERARADD